jgi:16S rRNA (cytosine1402-N4)-methyltransferase
MNIEQSRHIPVMLDEVQRYLSPRPGGKYIDGTLGGGGHTAAILDRSAPDGRVLGIDTDAQAIARAQQYFSNAVHDGRLTLVQQNFAELAQIAAEQDFTPVQGILLDLGFSSDQMDDPHRGFSFSSDGPLDMRLDPSLPLSAADIVNTAGEQELADIFWRYGEERRSRLIARRIVHERARGPIASTARLAAIAAAGVHFKPGTIHPATRAFQALRIAVNQELEHLKQVLPQMLDLLETSAKSASRVEEDGNMVVIAFHSLEDRIVKEFMRREAKDCLCPPQTPMCICGHKARLRILTPKPLVPTALEVERNPRARSAKLRAARVVVDS